MERVATVIPTYNRPKWLPGAVYSAMKKDWDDMVVIVVDDGSLELSRETTHLLEDLYDKYLTHDKEFTFHTHFENQGVAAALNTGLKIAREYGCEYFEWLSDDDRHLSHKTRLQMNYFRYGKLKKLGLVYAGYNAHFIEGPPEEGFTPSRTIRAISQYSPKREQQWNTLKKLCIINGSTALIKMEVFDDVGDFDTDFDYAQDYEMWIRIQRKWNTFRVPQVVCNRHEHPGTLTKYVDENKLNEDARLHEYIKDWELEPIE
jgi:GT2 family glycosyltransferase